MNFDDFHGEQRSTLTYGKHLHQYGKLIIMEVMKYYCDHPSRVADDAKYATLKRILDDIFEHQSKDIDAAWMTLMNGIGVESPEGVMTYGIAAFRPERNELLYKTFLTFGKIKPLDNETDWFNNFKIDGMCNGMNMVVWQDHDRPNTYGVRRDPEPIRDVNLEDPSHIIEIIVGSLRRFIIENGLYQINESYQLVKPVYDTMDAMKVCDECYKHYPFYYNGCHGCDFYRYSTISLSFKELCSFMKRYPSAIIGMVVNTATYASGQGRHWMALIFKNMNAKLIDSGGGDFMRFDDLGYLKNEIMRNGISMEWNPVRIQTDHSSCGMYSTLSLYLMLCNDCNIDATIDQMGRDCTSLVNGKSIMSFIKALAC